jgi:solute carrier family 45, member 1/2/4
MALTKSSNSPPSSPSTPKPIDPSIANSASDRRRESRDLDDGVNEQSPLLPPSRPSGEDDEDDDPDKNISPLRDDAQWIGDEHETRSSWYMFLLTLGGFGLQMGWAVEMSNGSPYLLSLGLNKALLALVWIAGPLSGVLVQPYVGLKSDRSRSKWGKRRPYLVGGAAATMLSLMILAWAREIVGGFLGIFGADPQSDGVAVTIMIFAVVFIYVLDFAINVRKFAFAPH